MEPCDGSEMARTFTVRTSVGFSTVHVVEAESQEDAVAAVEAGEAFRGLVSGMSASPEEFTSHSVCESDPSDAPMSAGQHVTLSSSTMEGRK